MLILTRRPVESINIGDDVVVTVLGVVGNQVRLGIKAPKSVPVHRGEIYERVKREGKQRRLDEVFGDEPRQEVNGNVAEVAA